MPETVQEPETNAPITPSTGDSIGKAVPNRFTSVCEIRVSIPGSPAALSEDPVIIWTIDIPQTSGTAIFKSCLPVPEKMRAVADLVSFLRQAKIVPRAVAKNGKMPGL